MKIWTFACAVALLAPSCATGGPSRDEVVADLGSDIVIPALGAFAGSAANLDRAIEDWCDRPSSRTHEAAVVALADARGAWKRTEAMWVGPIVDHRSWAVIDWPIARDEIDDLLEAPPEPLTTDFLGSKVGADQRGLGAVEYVLAGSEGRAPQQRECEYLSGLTGLLADEIELVLGDWLHSYEGGDPYVDRWPDDDMAIDDIVGAQVFLLDTITDRELFTALGDMDGEADLTAVVEGEFGLATLDERSRLAGVGLVLLGDDGESGLAPLLGDDLTARLGDQLDAATAALAAVGSPLRDAIEEDPDAARAAASAIKDLQITVSTEVVSRLGVSIGFSDNDGDSG